MRRPARQALAALAWGVGGLALARLPAGQGAVAALGLLRGPLGLAWLALALGVALARLMGARPGKAWDPAPRTLFVLSGAAYLVIGQHYASQLQPSGDEPHYLLMAQSLWREQDLDLRDNLERGDYREFMPGPIAPHWGATRPDGRPFPAHSVGLPLALAPIYALGGRRLCVALMALAAALVALEARRLAARLTGERPAALFAWALTAGPPLAFYSFHIYTEVPSALAVLVGLRLLLVTPTPTRAAAAALAAAALPWLHLKMIPAAAALGLVALVALRGRARLAFLVVASAAGGAFLAYYYAIYAVPSPLAVYGGLPKAESGPPVNAALGFLFDRSFGLLPHAPAFLLALAGLPLLLGRSFRTRWPYALVALAILAPVLPWRMWWGGQCPPGRFLVPLLPLLAAAAAQRLVGGITGLARSRWPLLAAGACLTVFMIARPADLLLLNRGDRPTRVWAALSGDVSVARYLPSLVRADAAEMRVALLWLAGLGLLLTLDRLARRQERVDRWFSGLGVPALLALGLGAGVDRWARNDEVRALAGGPHPAGQAQSQDASR